MWATRSCRKVIFSDEHMCSTNDNSCRTQWVREGEDELCLREKRRAQNACRLHVWGAIGVGFKFLVVLPVLELGRPFRLRSESYCELCIAPAIPHLQRKVFMQDGARPHVARATLGFLRGNGIEVLEGWPPYSPDLNPIENMWALLNRKVAERHPRTPEDLLLAVRAAWAAIPQRDVNALCRSFEKRVAECVRKSGGY
jgi:transposase